MTDKKTTVSDLIKQQMKSSPLVLAGEAVGKAIMDKAPTNVKLFREYASGKTSDITEKDFKPSELKEMSRRVMQQDAQNMEDESSIVRSIDRAKSKLKMNPVDDAFLINKEGNLTPKRTQEEHKKFYQETIKDYEKKLKTYNKDRSKTSVSYGEDKIGGGEGANLLTSIKESFTSPAYNVETSLGHFNAYKNKDGSVTIKDTYDFLGLGYNKERKISMKDFMSTLPLVKNPEQLGTLLARTFLSSKKRNVKINLPSLIKSNAKQNKKKKKSLIQ